MTRLFRRSMSRRSFGHTPYAMNSGKDELRYDGRIHPRASFDLYEYIQVQSCLPGGRMAGYKEQGRSLVY